jgi:carbon monoxide dehydrogenase subunit G
MSWNAEVSLLGPVGAMGQRVLQPIVKQQVNQVLGALDRRVTATVADAGSAPAVS